MNFEIAGLHPDTVKELDRRRMIGPVEHAKIRGISRATLDRMVKRGSIRAGRALSPGRIGWPLGEILDDLATLATSTAA